MLRRVLLEACGDALQLSPAQRRSLDELVRLNDLLDGAIAGTVARYTKQRDETRNFFISALGHDLRNPLGTITMAADLLLAEREALAPNHARVVERLANSADRMKRMLEDLLDFSRSHSKSGVPLHPVETDMRSLVADAVDELATLHPDRELRCNARAASGDFAGIWDRDRILRPSATSCRTPSFTAAIRSSSTCTISARASPST
jgi:signal transduction histidine kinase